MTAAILTVALTLPPTIPPDRAWIADTYYTLTAAGSSPTPDMLERWATNRRTPPSSLTPSTIPPTPKPAPAPAPAPQPSTMLPPAVEQWRTLVAAHFPPEHVDDALQVIACESGGDPNATNPSSSATGLYQFIATTWDWIAVPLGYPSHHAGGPFDPAASIHTAAVLSDRGQDWSHWVCRP